MTTPESDAIRFCVEDLLPRPRDSVCVDCNARTHFAWMEVETTPLENDQDPAEYGLVLCLTHGAASGDAQHSLPPEVIHKLVGNSFRIHPKQLGVHPWGSNITVAFSHLK